MRFLIIISLIALPVFLSAQIVNIETQRYQTDTTGWAGNFGTSFSLQKNTVEVVGVDVNAHVQYKTKKSLYLFLADYNFLKASGQTFADNLFGHFRYNYKVNKWLRWEAFTQIQKNNVTGIDLRFLLGTGPRFKLVGKKKLALYTATAAMYEYEKEQTTPPIYLHNIRSTSYISCTYKPSDKAEFISTIFYQPLYSNFNDYRILNETSIDISVAKHFSFVTTWSYLYDSRPVPLTPKLNYSISNGIQFKF